MLHDISSYDYKVGLPDNYTKFIPLGNGHIGASVWTSEKDKSEITLLLSATDSFSELGRILKLCKATITIEPNIFEEKQLHILSWMRPLCILIQGRQTSRFILIPVMMYFVFY